MITMLTQGKICLKIPDLMNRADLEAIARMELAFNMELRPRFKFDFSNFDAFNEVVDRIKDERIGNRITIAYTGDIIAGYLDSFMNDYRNKMEHRTLFVYPQYRKLGIGSVLLNEKEECAIKRKYNLIETYADIKVQPFYKKNGFAKSPFNLWGDRMIKKLK